MVLKVSKISTSVGHGFHFLEKFQATEVIHEAAHFLFHVAIHAIHVM